MDEDAIRDAKGRVPVGEMFVYGRPERCYVLRAGRRVPGFMRTRGVFVNHDEAKALILESKECKVPTWMWVLHIFKGSSCGRSVAVYPAGVPVPRVAVLAGRLMKSKMREEIERVCK